MHYLDEKPSINKIFTNALSEDSEFLEHIGVKYRSGRYPYGSGENPYQHDPNSLLSIVERKIAEGWKETPENIRELIGPHKSIGWYNATLREDRADRKRALIREARLMEESGKYSRKEIGESFGPEAGGPYNESTVRGWLKSDADRNLNKAQEVAKYLKEQVEAKGMVDVGRAAEIDLGINESVFKQALFLLEREGYNTYRNRIPQPLDPSKQTTQSVLCRPDYKHADLYNKIDEIQTLSDYTSDDGGETFRKLKYPASLDGKRVMIRYAEDGGEARDGLVELRRGVADLDLGNERYSQIRILVDGDRYIKGMAVYTDSDMPPGVDIIFNTNKSKNVDFRDVLKKISPDPENPFGATIKANGQMEYDTADGIKKLSPINKTATEGDWSDWTNALPSQFLSKQPLTLINKQLDLAKKAKIDEYNDILKIDNPTIRKHYLQKFSESADSAAEELKAMSLPGQKYQVLLPVNTLKDNEVFAPNYKDGTKLALVRYPHGGIFEIPILTVNNKNKEALGFIGKEATDAVAVNMNIRNQLSGADNDGDTVMAIPTHNGDVKIASRPYLSELKGFVTGAYGPDKTYEKNGVKYAERNGVEYRVMKEESKQKQMGVIANLLNDMNMNGKATDKELAKATKHSMVVIDAAKHGLDFRASEMENDIDYLKKKYQVTYDENGNVKYGGASTIISRAKGEARIPKTQGQGIINVKGHKDYDPSRPEGALIYKLAENRFYPERDTNKETGEVKIKTTSGKTITYNFNNKEDMAKYKPTKFVDDKGIVTFESPDRTIKYKVKESLIKTTQMAKTDDAMTLVSASRNPKEVAYAQYANTMKRLANEARLEILKTPTLKYDKSAAETFKNEVASLKEKLAKAEVNAVKERAVLRKATVEIDNRIKAYKDSGEELKKSRVKKIKTQAVSKYRAKYNSKSRKSRNIFITDNEWLAIQSGAVTDNILKRILNNSDPDSLREKATPKTYKPVSPTVLNKIKSYKTQGLTNADIAESVNLSVSTVLNLLKEN